jgi:hypothetical protein
MRKIFRLNKSGTSGASIPKEMKDAGYVVGALIEWVAVADGTFLLKLLPKPEPPKIEVAPVEAPKEEIKADSPVL